MVYSWVLPLASFIANLFMEQFKVKAISSVPNPYLWLRYVDYTLVIQQAEHSHQFLQYINSLDPHIQFTTEDPKDRLVPYSFLDTLVSLWTQQHPYNISVQKTKPTWINTSPGKVTIYLLAKYSIYNTLAHIAKGGLHKSTST